MTRRPPFRARRGVTLPFVCVMLTVLVGSAALAIDLGRLYYTTTEVQAAGDASALAAASASQFMPDSDSKVGPPRAQQVGALNRAVGQPVNIATADVLPMFYDPATRTATLSSYFGTVNAVQVTARAQANYILAGIFRLAAPSVARAGTAWIANVNGGACVRPISLPYTRIYEDANGLKTKPYSSNNAYAPQWTQQRVAALAPSNGTTPVSRTFVLIPPWEAEGTWDGRGQPNSGSWHTVDYQGNGWSAFQSYISAGVGSATCAPATTRVGTYLNPFVWNKPNDVPKILDNLRMGFVSLCNFKGNGKSAACKDGAGNVGVKVRVPMSDSIPNPNGPFTERVRMVTQVRIMCYFDGTYSTSSSSSSNGVSNDVCAAAPIKNGSTTATWQMPPAYSGGPPVDKGYPAGTVVVLLEGPVSVDLTPDLVLGDSLSFSQRLVLVK